MSRVSPSQASPNAPCAGSYREGTTALRRIRRFMPRTAHPLHTRKAPERLPQRLYHRCQREALGCQRVRFALDIPCADLCFRLRIHLLSLTRLAKAISLSVQWRQQAQVACRLSRPIRDLMAGPSASLDLLPGGMSKKPSEGGVHPSPSKQTLAAPCGLVI